MVTSLENLRLAHSKQDARPRNIEVEAAWRAYYRAYDGWRMLAENSPHSLLSPDTADALKNLKRKRDEALYDYFQAYDADQQEAFSDGES